MHLSHARILVSSAALLVLAFPARPQARLEPGKLKLPNLGRMATADEVIPARVLPVPHPRRLSNADYLQLRPHLALLLKVPVTGLAPKITDSNTFGAPGDTVSVEIGKTPPQGCSWSANWVSLDASGALTVTNGTPILWQKVDCRISFAASGAPPGFYLLTLYVTGPATKIACTITGDEVLHIAAPVQNGQAMVPIVLKTRRDLNVLVELPRQGQDPAIGVVSCDFVRMS